MLSTGRFERDCNCRACASLGTVREKLAQMGSVTIIAVALLSCTIFAGELGGTLRIAVAAICSSSGPRTALFLRVHRHFLIGYGPMA